MSFETIKTDFLIAGSGLAGLYAALHASQYGSVILVTKSGLTLSSSHWAQGGIAAVIDADDSFEKHISDTLQAGRGYCNSKAVKILVQEGAERVQELIKSGIPFDRVENSLQLGLEGGHSSRRIVHAGGASTGRVLVEFLIEEIKKNDRIRIFEHACIYTLLSNDNRCHGAMMKLYRQNKTVQVLSKAVILATGGYSGLFQRTTNPYTSSGDGLWLAYNAGAVLRDLEFVQFHPTAFYSRSQVFLISEALRGEGARLYNAAGERFMLKYPEAELSPRDVVSAEILNQIKKQDKPYVYLDVTHLSVDEVRQKFPEIISRIEHCGIDISNQGIPVAPAAHYCIGGVETGLHGETSTEGLFACGEVAVTGVHGANRLASNSLLECLVFSKRAVDYASENLNIKWQVPVPQNELSISEDLKQPFLLQKQVVSKMLNRYAGIERSGEELQVAIHKLHSELKSPLYRQGNEYFFIRMREMLRITEMIFEAALHRNESIGVHKRTDYPEKNQFMQTIRFHKSDSEKLKISNSDVS
ncbi:MAG: L-aspartate oxidase [Balneolaceae bacterium]|nr:L-aspartate oxidase [Balneolaceae bacterium]